MHTLEIIKADGRRLWIYGRAPVHAEAPAPMPPVAAASHMRWHPLVGEWVVYANHRQNRTFLPDDDPLAPVTDPDKPTELPRGAYDVAVFENRFPSLAADPGELPSVEGITPSPAIGRAEVIVFAQASLGLSELDADHVALVLEAIGHRTRALATQGMRYILPFENRGVEMGVTLHHPHGQIYAYSFLPAVQAHALYVQRNHYAQRGVTLIGELIDRERALGARIIEDNGDALCLAPPFGRFPYETWVLPGRPDVSHLDELSKTERYALAKTLKSALRRLDALFGAPMPYLMTFNQAPCSPCPEWTLRIEIWPIRRSRDKLKYLAGTELGAGVFASDVTPEQGAEALRKAAS